VSDGPPIARYDELNRYSSIIVDEAVRRGISVEILDPDSGEMVLRHGDRRVTTIQSLSELTSAVAFRRCDVKHHTRTVLEAAGLPVAPGRLATFDEADEQFLQEAGELVVKPDRGEQGWGITVGVRTTDELRDAIAFARTVWPTVLLEQRRPGEDLRVLVIGGEVVAASVRRPAEITGDGVSTVRRLVLARSAERQRETGGASTIPLDASTEATIRAAGLTWDSVPADGRRVTVRGTANLHTGGTIHDVTDRISESLAAVALAVARAIDIPVVGVDLIVEDITGDRCVVIEANEQPGLANHEPRPTAQRFIDLLFPGTAAPR
jgi:GNAT-family acetyltransferase (TIGR03103 family)